ncbi:hypothetical protein [Arenimonas sp.]|uniref:hypothetical protein n=1 Tax=Arenimonas sp. TaxID=1872635 RepID=UPI002E342507|nr:hypothetical protein [Arenimonas sp.]HEX4853649.1 hypothetical protein [Arenimonas sp.]
MYRMLLALSLALAAPAAFAAEPVPIESEAPGCTKAKPATGEAPAAAEGSTTAARPGTPAPVRPRAAGTRSGPRWHSLLPGMIR